MPTQTSQIDRDLAHLGSRPGDLALRERLAAHGLDLLPALEDYLARDLPIAVLEGYEEVLKAVLRPALAGEVSGGDARAIASFQQRVGPLLKYKSYAVKASSPLGYSIFLQNPGEGFSFQRHLTHKTEVFHILDVHPGGFVFRCGFDEWERCYDRERFAAWLAGEGPDPDYDRYRFAARPGDVFVLDELGTVHTVIGCTLEEFATISTDMVDRLHDQNRGKPIPAAFDKTWAGARLRDLRSPAASRRVAGTRDDPRIEELPARDVPRRQQDRAGRRLRDREPAPGPAARRDRGRDRPALRRVALRARRGGPRPDGHRRRDGPRRPHSLALRTRRPADHPARHPVRLRQRGRRPPRARGAQDPAGSRLPLTTDRPRPSAIRNAGP